jgi:hypothetical protein
MQYGGFIVHGPQLCPRPRFDAPPLWLYGGIFDQKSLRFFPVKALQSFSPSYLQAFNHQNRCSIHALGSCVGYHYNEVLELHLVLQLSSVAQVCKNVGPLTY